MFCILTLLCNSGHAAQPNLSLLDQKKKKEEAFNTPEISMHINIISIEEIVCRLVFTILVKKQTPLITNKHLICIFHIVLIHLFK